MLYSKKQEGAVRFKYKALLLLASILYLILIFGSTITTYCVLFVSSPAPISPLLSNTDNRIPMVLSIGLGIGFESLEA
jgi:polyferredoxin